MHHTKRGSVSRCYARIVGLHIPAGCPLRNGSRRHLDPDKGHELLYRNRSVLDGVSRPLGPDLFLTQGADTRPWTLYAHEGPAFSTMNQHFSALRMVHCDSRFNMER